MMDRGWYLLWVRDISFKLFRENVMRSIAVYGVIPVVGSLLLSGFAVDAGAVGTGNVSDVAAQSTVSVVASTVGTAVSSISQIVIVPPAPVVPTAPIAPVAPTAPAAPAAPAAPDAPAAPSAPDVDKKTLVIEKSSSSNSTPDDASAPDVDKKTLVNEKSSSEPASSRKASRNRVTQARGSRQIARRKRVMRVMGNRIPEKGTVKRSVDIH